MNTTQLYLGSVGWNNKYSHVVDFNAVGNKSAVDVRRDYFITNFTLLGSTRLLDRERGSLELEIEYTTFIRNKYNYIWVVETHDGYNYEWFAFVTAVSRNAKNTAIVSYEVDYWQTYFFDKDGNKAVFDIKDAFIQREHQDRWIKSDANNMVPLFSRTIEGLEVGDKVVTEQKVLRNYIIDKATGKKTSMYLDAYLVCVNETSKIKVPSNSSVTYAIYSVNNGVAVEELTYLLYFTIKEYTQGDDMFELYKPSNKKFYIQSGDETLPLYEYGSFPPKPLGGKMLGMDSDLVLAIKHLSYLPLTVTYEVIGSRDVLSFGSQLSANPFGQTLVRDVHLESGETFYTPIVTYNKLNPISLKLLPNTIKPLLTINTVASIANETKLMTQEFAMYKVNNAKSEPLDIIYENVNNTEVRYTNTLDFFAQNDLSLLRYNDSDFNYRVRHDTTNEQLIMNDSYKNYLKNNRNQIAVSQTAGVTTTIVGVASIVAGAGMVAGGNVGMGVGLIAGGVAGVTNSTSNIAQSVAKTYDYKNKVDEVKANVNTLGLDLATSGDAYRLTKYEIRPTFKARVYDLFKKQGYLSNEYKVPNLTSRYYFNYIKTGYIEINPQAIGEDAVRKIIEGIYLNGTTVWHYRNSSTFSILDYTKENVEMSLLS